MVDPKHKGNFCFPVPDDTKKRVEAIVDRVSCGEDAPTVLGKEGLLAKKHLGEASPSDGPVLMVVYTNCNASDLLGIGQLWELKKEVDKMTSEPIIIQHVDFDKADVGKVYERKLINTNLMVGNMKVHILPHEGDKGGASRDEDKLHPRAPQLLAARADTLKEISDRIKSFNGDRIDFYVMSRGKGNLHDLMRALQQGDGWPLKAKLKVSIYSGQHNMTGMSTQDLRALRDFVDTEGGVPLTDLSNITFFGEATPNGLVPGGRHEWTVGMSKWATESFGADLTKDNACLAASIQGFCIDQTRIWASPYDDKFIDRAKLSEDEKERFHKLEDEYDKGTPDSLTEFAKRLVLDEPLFAKVATRYGEQLKCVAAGGLSVPLTDTLTFLYEWLQKHHPDWLSPEDIGWWYYDKNSQHTRLTKNIDEIQDNVTVKAIVPSLSEPANEERLLVMRKVMEEYIFNHLKKLRVADSSECPSLPPRPPELHRDQTGPQRVFDAGNLNYPVTDKDMDDVEDAVRKMRENTYKPSGRAASLNPYSSKRRATPEPLVMVYTDLEPDDTMAIAQVWQWKRQREDMRDHPLLIWHVDFDQKEKGMIFEKKLLLAQRMLSVDEKDLRILLRAEEECGGKHPRHNDLLAARSKTVEGIVDTLLNFSGDRIDCYIISPGHGNLGAIVAELNKRGEWPKATWRVFLYSGAFNMRGMYDSDMDAITQFMARSKTPLVDMSKFPFFGGKGSHKWAASATTFASDNFAKELSETDSFLAGALRSFNDEFNVHLIEPGNKSLFKGSELTDDERERFNAMKRLYYKGGRYAVQEYAKALVSDDEVFKKVVGFKKNTLKAYAGGGCDSPLCDQLTFLYEWLMAEMPDCLDGTTPGAWVFNKEKGFTQIVKDGDGPFKAIQPFLKNPKDEESLMKMRCILETNLMTFLKANLNREHFVELIDEVDTAMRPITPAVFQSFWKTIDTGNSFSSEDVENVMKEALDSNGEVDIKKLMNWALV